MKRGAYVLALGLTLAAAGIAGCGGAQDRKAEHLERGAALFAEGNYEKARLEFKNALQIDPKDAQARYRLGETLEELQQWRAAAGHYKAVVEQDPAHVASRTALAKLYLLGNAEEEALTMVEEVLALEPDNPDALVVRAGVKARDEDLEGALADVRAALEEEPAHPRALSLAAALHLRQGREQEGIALLERGVAAHPDNTGLRASLAAVYARTGDNARAAEMLEALVAAAPEELSHRLRLASFHSQLEQPERAEAVLRQAVADLPGEDAAKLALVEFLAKHQGGEQAVAALDDFVRQEPENHTLRLAQARIFRAMGRSEDERAVYEEVIAGDPEGKHGLRARRLLARLAAGEGSPEEARGLLEEVLAENPKDADALELRGDLAMQAGDLSGAIADYRTVLQARPGDTRVALALSRAHLANDQRDLAEEVLRTSLKRNPGDTGLRFRLAELLVAGDRLDAGVGQLEKVLEEEPADAKALEGLVKLHLRRNDRDAARRYIERYQDAYPERPQGYYFEGLLLQAQGEMSEGTAAFERSLEQAGAGAVQPLSAVVRSHVAAGDYDKALQRVNAVIADKPDNFVAHNLKGEVLLLRKEYAAAEAAFSAALEHSPRLVAAHRNRALARFAQGDREGAVAAFRAGIEATSAPALRFALAGVLEGMGRVEEAIQEHQAVLDAAPGSLAAANNLAMLLATYREDAESLDRALELAEPLGESDNAAYLDTLGWVHYKRGEYRQALPLLERAVAGDGDAPVMQFHLGMVHYRLDNPEAAAEHLARALTGEARFREADLARSTLEAIRGG